MKPLLNINRIIVDVIYSVIESTISTIDVDNNQLFKE